MSQLQVWGDTYNNDSELGEKTVRARLNSNYIIRSITTRIIVYNNPSFTSLNMKIYNDLADETKGYLLHTSTNSPLKSEICTLANGWKYVTFLFDDIQIDGANYYHYAIDGVSSGLSGSSTIAWYHGYPDPIYRTGLSLTLEELMVMPYDLFFVGAEL